MAILTKQPVIKGEASEFTINKEELLLLPKVQSHASLSDMDNWDNIKLTYTNAAGQIKTLRFKASDASPKARFLAGLKALGDFNLKSIMISDIEGLSLRIRRSELSAQIAEFDVELEEGGEEPPEEPVFTSTDFVWDSSPYYQQGADGGLSPTAARASAGTYANVLANAASSNANEDFEYEFKFDQLLQGSFIAVVTESAQGSGTSLLVNSDGTITWYKDGSPTAGSSFVLPSSNNTFVMKRVANELMLVLNGVVEFATDYTKNERIIPIVSISSANTLTSAKKISDRGNAALPDWAINDYAKTSGQMTITESGGVDLGLAANPSNNYNAFAVGSIAVGDFEFTFTYDRWVSDGSGVGLVGLNEINKATISSWNGVASGGGETSQIGQFERPHISGSWVSGHPEGHNNPTDNVMVFKRVGSVLTMTLNGTVIYTGALAIARQAVVPAVSIRGGNRIKSTSFVTSAATPPVAIYTRDFKAVPNVVGDESGYLPAGTTFSSETGMTLPITPAIGSGTYIYGHQVLGESYNPAGPSNVKFTYKINSLDAGASFTMAARNPANYAWHNASMPTVAVGVEQSATAYVPTNGIYVIGIINNAGGMNYSISIIKIEIFDA